MWNVCSTLQLLGCPYFSHGLVKRRFGGLGRLGWGWNLVEGARAEKVGILILFQIRSWKLSISPKPSVRSHLATEHSHRPVLLSCVIYKNPFFSNKVARTWEAVSHPTFVSEAPELSQALGKYTMRGEKSGRKRPWNRFYFKVERAPSITLRINDHTFH